jgi:hypothetical protein
MKGFNGSQLGEPKPRLKKANCDTATVVHKTARAGDEDFAYFVSAGKLLSIK